MCLVSQEDWHQIFNPFEEECKLLKFNTVTKLHEEDIERLEFL